MRACCILLLSVLAAACVAEPDPAVEVPPPPGDGLATPEVPVPGSESVPLLTEGERLPPVDEGPDDPSFLSFRQSLLEIVRARDSKRLLQVVDPEIRFTFGAGGGKEDFIRHWKLDGEGSPLWGELERVLALGGTFQETPTGRRFFAPYIYSEWPESVDAFEYLAVTCPDAVVRSAAGEESDPLVRVDHHLVRAILGRDVSGPGEGTSWRRVALPDGREGWIAAECVRSPIDYRAAFEEKGGAWRMVFFVAGD